MQLSIVIPTYDRPESLERLLRSLARQWPEIDPSDTISIVVHDNASPLVEQIATVVEAARSAGLTVHYYRNEVNIGPDANFLLALSRAVGDYVWLLGDDDILRPNIIPFIISELKEISPVYAAFSFDLNGMPRPGIVGKNVYSSFTDYVEDTLWHSSFISISIFEALSLRKALEGGRLSYFVGGNLIQFHIIDAVCCVDPVSKILLSPLVILDQTRAEYSDWSYVGPAFLFGMGRFSQFVSTRGKAETKALRAIRREAVKRVPASLLNSKAKGKLLISELPLVLYTYGDFIVTWIAIGLALALPGCLLRFIREVAHKNKSCREMVTRWFQRV